MLLLQLLGNVMFEDNNKIVHFYFVFHFDIQLTLCFLNLVSLALCSTTNVADETRKTSVRSAAATVGTSAHLNSLQSSQDSGGKQQTVQQVQSGNGQTTYTRVQTPEFTSITQPHNAVYSQPTAPTGGYFISVNPQNVPSGALGAGKTTHFPIHFSSSNLSY